MQADGAWRQLASLVLPVRCPGCGRPDAPWCSRCAAALLGAPARTAGAATPWGAGGAGGAGPPTWAAAAYAGAVRELLVAWKEHGRHDLTPLLATALARALRAALVAPLALRAQPVVLLPVPSSRRAVRGRGAALTADLAHAAAAALRATGAPRVAVAGARSGLHLARTPRDQAGLGAAERAANLEGAHRAGPAVRGAVCVVVDDITTTGATVQEAARAVRSAGGLVVAAATVAATPRRSADGVVSVVRPGARH